MSASDCSGGDTGKETSLADRLRQRAAERAVDAGCEHTSDFGEWCSMCREQEVTDMRAAADALDAKAEDQR